MEINPFLGTLIGNLIISISIISLVKIVSFFRGNIIKYTNYIISLTVGLLLSIIFLGFLPNILENHENTGIVGIFILVGLLSFYLLEILFHWHHCKCTHNKGNKHKSGELMFVGTFIHNSFHGIILFGAFSVDFHFGIATTFAVLLHSIPQNVVNIIMNNNSPKNSYIAGIGGIFGALLTYPFYNFLTKNEKFILPFILGGLLYIALSDVLPEIKEKASLKDKIKYFLIIIIGILCFVFFEKISGVENHHNNTNEVHIMENGHFHE